MFLQTCMIFVECKERHSEGQKKKRFIGKQGHHDVMSWFCCTTRPIKVISWLLCHH